MARYMFDVGIIGAGVVGCAIARELSRYNVSVCLIEKYGDVSCGASKANSGMVHGGYSARAGTLKGLLCGRGNSMFAALEEELHFGYRKTGGLVIGFSEEYRNTIYELCQNGVKTGYADTLEIIGPERIMEMEPNINHRRMLKLILMA
jgi:glycerol-3-phosphate dehydrogenase